MASAPSGAAAREPQRNEAEPGGDDAELMMEPPAVYLLHFLDDDIFRPGIPCVQLAQKLDPCRVVVLGYDDEAYEKSSLADLASVYVARIFADLAKSPSHSGTSARVVLIGYAFGAVVGHRVACLLREREVHVGFVAVDSEARWPPSHSVDRMGGYQWLGGETEAVLLACRALGGRDAAREAVLQQMQAGASSSAAGAAHNEELQMSVFWRLAPLGVSQRHFQEWVEDTAPLLERLHGVCQSAADEPQLVFGGPALLAQSASPEFRTARAVNEAMCSGHQVVTCRGSHYTMAQDEHVQSLVKVITDFLVGSGFFGDECQRAAMESVCWIRDPVAVPGLEVTSDGDDPAAGTVYVLHDAQPFISRAWKDRVTDLLAPCRVAFVKFDAEAADCAESADVARLYQHRIALDARSRTGCAETAAPVAAPAA